MTEANDSGAQTAPAMGNAILPEAAPAAMRGDHLTAAEKAYFAARGAAELPVAAPAAAPDHGAADSRPPAAVAEEPARAKTVPHAALHAEREEHKKTRAQLQQMRAQALEWQQELAALQPPRLPIGQEPREAPAVPPDPREDFIGFARWQGQEISRLQAELAAGRRQAEETQRAQAAETAIMQEWDKAVQDVRRTAPDIDAALEFLQQARLSQLGVLAPVDPRFADKAFCEKQLYAELRDIVIGTFQQGKNPAAVVYDIARSYGYGRDETARMDRIKQAAAGARSLTAGAGNGAGDPLLLETVANMPEAEFAQWYEHNRAGFRAMFGG